MPKVAKPLPKLDEAQKELIEQNFRLDPNTLLGMVFPDKESLDQRSVEWKAIRLYIAEMNGKQKAPPPLPETASLTDEQKEFIGNAYKSSNPTEIARILFSNPRLNGASFESQLVLSHIRQIEPGYRKEDDLAEEYAPPRSIVALAGRLNEYKIQARADGKKLFHDGELSAEEKKGLDALMSYMQLPVFKVEADKFVKRLDREVFESVFISTCWDKPDLSAEHVIQYIQLASLTSQRNIADRLVRKLDERFTISLEDDTKKLSKPEVDALNATKEKATEHLKQINSLIKTLTGERFKMINERIAGSSSMHPLVQAWKRKEDRNRIIKLVEKKQQTALKQEVERFSTMDSLRGELWGIDPNTIIH
jgi:hypothetical protein